MMDDYERVVELQEISTRSAGATAAQAGTYLEGMEAAINKIQVAWEKIVMTFSDSEFIIGAMNVISGVMDTIGNLLNSGEVMIPVLIAGATVMLKTIGLKLQEQHISKENAKIEARMNELRAKMNKEKLKADLKTLENQKEIYKGERAQQRITKEELYDAKIKQAVEKGDVELEKQLREEKERGLKEFDEETNKTLEFYDESISITKEQIKLQEEVIVQYERQKNAISSGANAVMGYATAFKDAWTSISQSVKGIIDGIKSVSEASKKASTPNQANSAAMIPMIGWIISLILLGGSLISTIIGIVAGIWKTIEGWIEDAETSAEGTAKAINALSAEIYNLNQQANQLDDISSKFEELDSKIVKTNKDLEEMESLLESAGESLNTEEAGKNTEEALRYGEGNSQKESYQIAVQDGRASEWLEEEEEWLRGQANSRRQEQLEKVENMKESEKEDFFDEDTSSAEIKQAQGAIKAINQNTAYEYIDYLKETTKVSNEAAKATEDLTSQILKNLSVEDAYNYAQSEDAVASLVDSLIQLEQTVTDLEGEKVSKTIAEILQSDDYSLKEQVAAYNSAIQALEGIEEEAFKAAYVHMEFWTGLTDNVLDFIDAVGMSADEINKWHITGKKLNSNDTFWSNLGLDGSNYDFESIWEDRFNSYISTIAELNGDVAEATRRIFGDFLGDQEENMNYFLNAYADIVEVGILDMGQNIDKIRNSINGFYEKALEWNTMSESDKTAFIQDHMDLFTAVDDAGNQIGSQLLKAFESGDYAAIENALNENTALRDLIEKRKEEIEQALLIEREKTGKDRNEAYISQLEEYKSYLNDVENLFKASLELRLEQEKKQLDEYRNYLEEQKDALTESLEKRKDAYDKYFDSISETEEDEDYEKETSTLIANISRLSSSSNADAKQQTAELEQELRALEEERLQTLKERAREAILENMESEISEINEKFDKLLDSSQALLYAMNGELDNPVEFMSNMISTQIESGASALEVEDYINSLQSTYGSVLGDSVDWDAIQVREENNQLILNVNGQDIVLNQQDERSVYEAVKKALRAVGLR